MRQLVRIIFAFAVACSVTIRPAYSQAAELPAHIDDDGSNLWLKYHTVRDTTLLADYRSKITQIIAQDTSPLGISARDELIHGLSHLLAQKIPNATAVTQHGTIVIGSSATSTIIASLGWEAELNALGDEGFIIYPVGNGHAGKIEATEFAFYESPKPWGPWRRIKSIPIQPQGCWPNSNHVQDRTFRLSSLWPETGETPSTIGTPWYPLNL